MAISAPLSLASKFGFLGNRDGFAETRFEYKATAQESGPRPQRPVDIGERLSRTSRAGAAHLRTRDEARRIVERPSGFQRPFRRLCLWPCLAATWLGARPCFPDSRPVIGRAPGRPGLWLAWGLTLGPPIGRLIAEMMTGATPFCDPQPYAVEGFTR
jgi:glycine/D-amino acid oxidase-like deaminating enzyme